MPFHLYNCPTIKYSSIEYQRLHEREYKKFLKTLQTNNNNNSINVSEEKVFKNRQINVQYRQNKRKIEYERIQKENLKFSQKLINAKTFFNRYEQQLSFDKHCQLKQRLQRYPDLIRTKTIKSNSQFSSNHNSDIINKPTDSSFLIYNDNGISHRSIKGPEKIFKNK
jgi:hypothetical protein